MDASEVTYAVHQVLLQIQQRQSLGCPSLIGSTRPLRELDKFDSPISIAATGMIGRRLGIQIPSEMNLFGDSKEAYSIDKTVGIISRLMEKQAATDKVDS